MKPCAVPQLLKIGIVKETSSLEENSRVLTLKEKYRVVKDKETRRGCSSF